MPYRLTTLLICSAFLGNAADLALTPASAAGNFNVTLATQGASLTGLQFDVEYDAALTDLAVDNGAASTRAGKSLQSTVIQPGKLRVLIIGFNQNQLADGIVATLRVTVKSESGKTARAAVRLVSASGTNAGGEAVTITLPGQGRGGK